MSSIYIIAGTIHFLNPDFYDKLMPEWLSYHYPLIYFSGVVEILLGAGLLFSTTRRMAAWLIIGMLIVFFFVIHVPMTINLWNTPGTLLWISIARLPLQFYLIWWAWKLRDTYFKKSGN